MAEVFVYADGAQGASELVSLAHAAGREAVVLAVADAGDMAQTGADKVVVLKGKSARVEDYAQAAADLVRGADALLASSTVRGRELAAHVAGLLDCAMFSDASSIEFADGGAVATRSVYGGSVVSAERAQGFFAATLMPGAAEPAEGAVANVQTVDAQADARVACTAVQPVQKGGVDLASADVVVSVGLGLDNEDDLAMVTQLAETLGAGMGCTRDVAERRKWLPKEQYIGITGAIVKPKMYLAVGVSGAMQHVFGVRDSKLIVAVNRDKDAQIFRCADYGIIGDLHAVVPKLTEALKAL